MKTNHGANLFDLANNQCLKKEDFMDFSSNINPFGVSKKAKQAIIDNINMISIYPDPNYANLKSSISSYCNCNKENIILGSGATELISSFIETIYPKKALLLSPCYSEYENELKKINCSIKKFFSKEDDDFKIDINHLIYEIKNNNFDLVIICNPNNPTGFAFNKEEIKFILENSNCFVMIDETYIEFTNKYIFSTSSLVNDFSKLFVIRGTSKFFSTPGIRLGYGLISNQNIYERILEHIDLWNINIFASIIGEVMFTDKEYIDKTISEMKKEQDFLFNSLKSFNDLKVYQSYGNFILCKIKSKKITARELYEKLLAKHIIIRNCSSFEGLDEYYFRVCILTPSQNKILIKELQELLK